MTMPSAPDWIDEQITWLNTRLITSGAGSTGPVVDGQDPDLSAGEVLLRGVAESVLLARLAAVEASADVLRELISAHVTADAAVLACGAAVEVHGACSRRLALWALRVLAVAVVSVVVFGLGVWAEVVVVAGLLAAAVVGCVRSCRGEALWRRYSDACAVEADSRIVLDVAMGHLQEGQAVRVAAGSPPGSVSDIEVFDPTRPHAPRPGV
jgi:hypothetical protein